METIKKEELPFVTLVIPTYNEEKNIERCLESINKQDYPKEKLEVLVIDDSSEDKTVEIAKRFGATVYLHNFNDYGHGKSIGMEKAKGEIVGLLDADNEIVQTDWLSKMVIPFIKDTTIFGVDSKRLIKEDDLLINRYCNTSNLENALARILSEPVESVPHREFPDYTLYNIRDIRHVPQIGSNGFLWRKKVILDVGNYRPKFEEGNFICLTFKKGYTKFARVGNYGIYHHHVSNLRDYIKKRSRDAYLFFLRKARKEYTWVEEIGYLKLFFAMFYWLTFICPLIEAIKNYIKTKETAWLIHPLMCFVTINVYFYRWLSFYFKSFSLKNEKI
jgi:glycosyltransferase involved in cell wall biosynthesis